MEELSATPRRVRVRVTGTVQGVGFRPHVYRLAGELGLAGYVLNDERGVLCEIEGQPAAVTRFLERLATDAPPLAVVEDVDAEEMAATGGEGFEIAVSERVGEPLALVSPDVATCEACLAELLDSADRRHRYPFINCTDCGPRFTIVRGVPYDRPLTTMAGFEMCASCRAEYEDPGDRRFHAQPNACAVCGPTLALLDGDGRVVADPDPLARASEALKAGLVVAVKGLGGYHLACGADHEGAAAALRERKHREDKPFALMAEDLDAARALVELTPREEQLLLGRERPIVVARRRQGAGVAAAVAPGSPDLGVMLPYSPLHHLLLADAGVPLVMTSGNVSDEPIAYGDEDAVERMRGIADLFLVHDRPIQTRTDDSVVRSLGALRAEPLMLRRSRGYVPASVALPIGAPPLLACGAELKSAFCLARGERAWVSHHIGDLKNFETLGSFEEGVEHFQRLFAVRPEVVAHDLHPDYLSTKYALEREGVETVGVQHHHAHLAACLAEHGETGPAVGAIYDGTGYGEDGGAWGGELLVGDLGAYERAGSLLAVRMPGGDRAVEEPWRMACSWLLAAGLEAPEALVEAAGVERWRQVSEVARAGVASPLTSSMGRLFDAVGALCGLRFEVSYEGQAAAGLEAPEALVEAAGVKRWRQVSEVARAGVASPLTSSMGRLFDAVGALCGLRFEVTYEGQAAVGLEAAATAAGGAGRGYPLPFFDRALDGRETITAVKADLDAGAPASTVAARFHAGVASGTAEACARVASEAGLDRVVLSGGVFQNRLLVELTVAELRQRGLRVLLPKRLPPNDGGIAYGQAAVAAARLAG